MTASLRSMTIDDYPSVTELWRRTEGIGLGDSDTREAIEAFLLRNPAMSVVAEEPSGKLAGAVLCGHDGRRGYLHHLAVSASHRNAGVAARLVAWCLERLVLARIPKCNVFLFEQNVTGAAFWEHNEWAPRDDLRVFQKLLRV